MTRSRKSATYESAADPAAGRSDGVKAVTRQTLSDRVYDEIRSAILRGDLATGTEINQVQLANSLGVSRVPVREALRRLQAERLLIANPFSRIVVNSFSEEQVIELFELREELEVFALRRAMKREDFASAVLPVARKASAKLKLTMAAEDWYQADREFHRILNCSTSAVANLVDDVRSWIYREQHRVPPNRERRQAVLTEHKHLLDRLAAGDTAGVEAAIREHISGTREFVTGDY